MLLLAIADMHVEDCDSHAYSFARVLIGSLGEELEHIIIIWLALNDELGTWYLSLRFQVTEITILH